MYDATIGLPSEEPIGDKRHGMTRRQVGVAAAWALPVIAAATAVPLAAASTIPRNASLTVSSGSEISVLPSNAAGSVVSGDFGGNATITNSGNDSSVDLIRATYTVTGPIDTQFLMFGTQKLGVGGVNDPLSIQDGSLIWSVTAIGNQVQLTLQGTITVYGDGVPVSIHIPVLNYVNELTGVAADPFKVPGGQQVRAGLSFTVSDTSQGSIQTGDFKLYPTD